MQNTLDNGSFPKIIVQTHAYNVEKYIRKALQSMIDQTYENWEWYLTENASTDHTIDVIEDFLRSHPDDRIHLLKRKYNTILQPGKEKDLFFDEIMPNLVGKGYFYTELDSDDYFTSQALEIMIKPVIEHGVDYVITGRQAFSDVGWYAADLPVTKLFPNIAELSYVWPQNYKCMRTLWGKLFRMDDYCAILQDKELNSMVNGRDTYENLMYMQRVSSAASVGKVTVNFCIRPDSIFHANVYSGRYLSYLKIYQKTIELFRQWNRMQPVNLLFAAQVLRVSMQETIAPAAGAIYSASALELVKNILTDQTVYQVLDKYDLYDAFLYEIFALMEKNFDSQKAQTQNKPEQYFHIWILRGLTYQTRNWHLALCCMIRGVLMGENRYRVGMKYVKDLLITHTSGAYQKLYSSLQVETMKKMVDANPLAFIEMLCGSVKTLPQYGLGENWIQPDLFEQIRQEQTEIEKNRCKVAQLIESGDIVALRAALDQSTQLMPLDYVTLYAKMFLFCVDNDLEPAALTAGAIEYLYPYNQLLVDMAAMILEESGYYSLAYSLYKKNLYYADELKKSAIEQKMNQLAVAN